jgi:type VI secretion system ImpB/VipA family protein
VAKQVPALSELLNLRQQLAALVARIDGKDDITSRLEKLLREADQAIATASAAESGTAPTGSGGGSGNG